MSSSDDTKPAGDKAPTRHLLWPKTNTEAGAVDAAKAGVVGGGMMTLGLLLPVAFMAFSGDSGLPIGFDSPRTFYISQGIQIALAAFLTWSVWRCQGRFSAILLLIWLTIETASKLAAGSMDAGWMIAWAFAWLSLLHSVRGHWALHRIRKQPTAEIFE